MKHKSDAQKFRREIEILSEMIPDGHRENLIKRLIVFIDTSSLMTTIQRTVDCLRSQIDSYHGRNDQWTKATITDCWLKIDILNRLGHDLKKRRRSINDPFEPAW